MRASKIWSTGLPKADDGPERERQTIPDLDGIPPGPFLAVILAAVDRSRLNGYDLVRLLRARHRLVSHLQAGMMADSTEIAHTATRTSESAVDRTEQQFAFASDEIRAALTLTRYSAELFLSLATDVCEELPDMWELLDRGEISIEKARVISHETSHLTSEQRRVIVEQIRDHAPLLTTGELRTWIRRLCVETDPEEAAERMTRASDERRLVIEATEDHVGNVFILGIPLSDAKAIGRRVNGYTISLKKEDRSGRTHDQLRADIAVDLLLGSDPTNGGRGLVDIRVDLKTLAALDEKAAEIPGMGPVIADIARQVAQAQPKAEWRYVVTDDHGSIVNVGTTKRRPDSLQTRWIQALHPTCVHPGCRMPATECDLDHELPWAQTRITRAATMSPECRHHHVLLDHGWKRQRINGKHVFTSPLGHTYTSHKPL